MPIIMQCEKCKGVINFLINNRTVKLQADGDVTVLVSNQRRTEGYDGEFTVEERNPRITATLVVPIDMRVKDIQEYCDSPVEVQLCDGRTFASQHASNISDNPYDAKRNLQPIELILDAITEQVPRRLGQTTAIGGMNLAA